MRIDPYKHKERYKKWKEDTKDCIPDITKDNSRAILLYLNNMENGINVGVGTRKGARSYIRLNTLRVRMVFLAKQFKKRFNVNLLDISEEQLGILFTEMRSGKIRKSNGEKYKSAGDFVKDFKAFWHWHMKINRKNKKIIDDITVDLDTKRDKSSWTYITYEQVKKLANNAKEDYQVLIWFLFDTGIRAPTELMNVKVSDIYFNPDKTELNIRDDTSKTFGRRIKLMLCSEFLKRYIKEKNLKDDDYLFKISPPIVNKYLKRLAKRIFGNDKTLAGKYYNELTMYDFRHSSACYWVSRYKDELSLKYRFGWKKSDMIYYYTEFLGMKDNITDEEMMTDVDKTDIQKKLEKSEKEKSLLQERMNAMEEQMNRVLELTNELHKKVG